MSVSGAAYFFLCEEFKANLNVGESSGMSLDELRLS